MLSSGMITRLFFIFPGNFTHSFSILYQSSRIKYVSAGNRTRVACVAGVHSSKELLEQLIPLLFVISTYIDRNLYTVWTRDACVAGVHSSKELLEQLILLPFVTSTHVLQTGTSTLYFFPGSNTCLWRYTVTRPDDKFCYSDRGGADQTLHGAQMFQYVGWSFLRSLRDTGTFRRLYRKKICAQEGRNSSIPTDHQLESLPLLNNNNYEVF